MADAITPLALIILPRHCRNKNSLYLPRRCKILHDAECRDDRIYDRQDKLRPWLAWNQRGRERSECGQSAGSAWIKP